MNLTLIGMPGSGKSSVGKKLAELLHFQFIDLDQVMEHEHNKPLQEILDTLGDRAFLTYEAESALRTTAELSATVISPGGSIIYSDSAMQHLQKISRIIYLEVPLHILEERVGARPRGIVSAHTKTLEQIYHERMPIYRKWASLTLDGEGTVDEVATRVSTALRSESLQ